MSSYYASYTHGRIPMSGRGRQLFQALRNAAEAAVRVSYWGHNDHALSKARGELALYVSELEKLVMAVGDVQTAAPQTSARSINELRYSCAKLAEEYARSHVNGHADISCMLGRLRASCVRDLDYAGLLALERELTQNETVEDARNDTDDIRAALALLKPGALFYTPKEKTTMNEESPKKRSDLLAAASVELCQAQRALESLDTMRDLPAPAQLKTIYAGNDQLNAGLGLLAVERWDEMRDEVIYRAEVRVWEAENAVAALLGVERDAPKPRKPRTKSKKD